MNISLGHNDHASKLYNFVTFQYSLDSSFIFHVHSLIRVLYEWFNHLIYRYLQVMFNKKLVLGIPKVSCTNGACVGCTFGKQSQDPFLKAKYLREKTPLELMHSDLVTFSTPFLRGQV